MYQVTVRYFAAAAAAAGTAEEVVQLAEGATVADLLEDLQRRHAGRLPQVLRCSSFLLDEVVVHDRLTVTRPGALVDVLPPFAGG
ncbi:MoaD/ThiS family protein [Streptomyces chartreusis]|uniref:MoaD/ThiS family protein n=1 Tax=Streptomyces chartreusis TaxID=1969 RepID=UPI00362E3EF4